MGGVSDGTTLWFIKGSSDDDIIAYLASDQSRQTADDITHADLAGSLLGGVYANGTAWFVEPDADTAIAFRQTTAHAVDAGGVSFAFDLPEPTVTHIAAPTVQLVLSDSDDTGLEVVAKALLAASAAATVAGNIFWGGRGSCRTDTPLDGELGLGAGNTVISRFRRVSATVLVLNDNDNPSAFDIGAYFNTGGGGNDLTLYFQTLSGEVSFPVATQLLNQGGAFAQFTLPAAAQTLLDGMRAVTGLFSRLPSHQRHPQTMPLTRETQHSLLPCRNPQSRTPHWLRQATPLMPATRRLRLLFPNLPSRTPQPPHQALLASPFP